VGVCDDWTDGLIESLAVHELTQGGVGSYNSREGVNIIVSLGKLVHGRGVPSSAVQGYMEELVSELVRRMGSLPYVKESCTAGDFSDIVHACASVYGRVLGTGNEVGAGVDCGEVVRVKQPADVGVLVDLIMAEVRRQLANKHSLRSELRQRDLIRLLRGLATLGHRSAAVDGALDAIANFVVRRIMSRHLNAMARPRDIAAVLQAYADLRHNSVAIPELLTAVGQQVCAFETAHVRTAGRGSVGEPHARVFAVCGSMSGPTPIYRKKKNNCWFTCWF
jgi:hypothetical protein